VIIIFISFSIIDVLLYFIYFCVYFLSVCLSHSSHAAVSLPSIKDVLRDSNGVMSKERLATLETLAETRKKVR
jgi:hypothetical protein